MAYIFGDGFDHYGNTGALFLRKYYGAWSIATDYVRTGSNSLGIGNGSNISLEAPALSYIWGAAFRFPNLNDIGAIEHREAGGSIFSIGNNPQGAVLIRAAGYNGTILAQSANNILQAGTFQYIEVGYQNIGASTDITVRVNNQIVVQVVGANLGAARAVTYLGINYSAGNFDDYYEADFTGSSTYQGDIRLRARPAISNGTLADWLPTGDANAWQAINHVPPLPGTNFIASSAAGQQSSFALTALPTNVAAIQGVTVFCRALKTDAGGASVDFGLKSGAALALKGATPVGTGEFMYVMSLTNDPNTGIPFTLANAQNALAYVERAA